MQSRALRSEVTAKLELIYCDLLFHEARWRGGGGGRGGGRTTFALKRRCFIFPLFNEIPFRKINYMICLPVCPYYGAERKLTSEEETTPMPELRTHRNDSFNHLPTLAPLTSTVRDLIEPNDLSLLRRFYTTKRERKKK